jgi:hypothetical protein
MSVHGAEPLPAETAVESGVRIAGLIHGRNGLTGPLEVSGFCLILLLQHSPSSEQVENRTIWKSSHLRAVYAYQSARDARRKFAELRRVLRQRRIRCEQREHAGIAAESFRSLREIQSRRSFGVASYHQR